MIDTKKRVPRGIRNNNPLNIRKGNNWIGERKHQSDPAFEEFESMEMGFRAALKLIKKYISGDDGRYQPRDTIAKIVSRWAPPSENATLRYIDIVAEKTGLNPHEVVFFSERKKIVSIVRAMAFVECGQWFDNSIIETAYDLV